MSCKSGFRRFIEVLGRISPNILDDWERLGRWKAGNSVIGEEFWIFLSPPEVVTACFRKVLVSGNTILSSSLNVSSD
jgi:hypothetical protein